MERPDDLVALKEAAVMVGRSVSTLRAWIRGGELTSFREEEADPSSKVLVSREALLRLAAMEKPIHPGGPRKVQEETIVAPDTGRNERMAASLSAERDGLKALVEAQRLTISTMEARCRDLEQMAHQERLHGQEMRDRLVAAEAELQAMRGLQRLPWYRRLLGTTG
jgi:hypothetical protein